MAVGNQDAEAQGLDYISNNQYLQDDFTGSTPLDFSNVSSSGIMSQAPIIYPPINQGGGGDGPVDPGPTDYGYTGPGSTGSVGGFNIDDIGEGTIDDEDEDKTTIGPLGLAKIAGSTLFGGPFSGAFTGYREREKAKQAEIDKINAAIEAQYGPSDPGLRGNDGTPGFGITAAGNYTNQFDGGDPGQGDPGNSGDHDGGASADAQSDDAAGAGGYARGGRVGYFFGGRVNYKAGGRVSFKNGGLASIL